jgi:uncharacterized protein with GYD domain
MLDIRRRSVVVVPKYAALFRFKGETIKAMMARPGDRAAAVQELVESAGGTLDVYYLMFGQYDGLVILDLPDSASAAAVSFAVSSSAAFSHLETHELVPAEQLNPVLEKASRLTYRPPGS